LLRSAYLVMLSPGLAGAPLARVFDLALAVPGSVRLEDGRRIQAELIEARSDEPLARSPWKVELDARSLAIPLRVRLPRAGDRFHALGAPGSKRLTRYLADRGLPREERRAVPLVFAGEELLWVTGFAPCEAHRVRPGTARRLRLALEPAAR
jgi:tRNA(Ile)-lysidine synthase